MKKVIFLFVTGLLLTACKNNQSDQSSELLRGEFIYTNDAAVLKGDDFIYGVVIDDMTKKLSAKIKPLQREEYDMVPVVIKGIIKPNPGEGWEQVVEIKEIIGVSEPTSAPITKIKSAETANKEESKTEEKGREDHNH